MPKNASKRWRNGKRRWVNRGIPITGLSRDGYRPNETMVAGLNPYIPDIPALKRQGWRHVVLGMRVENRAGSMAYVFSAAVLTPRIGGNDSTMGD